MYYLHWEDWPMALPHPSLHPIAPPSLTPPLHAAYIYDGQAEHRHTLPSTMTHFMGEIGPLSQWSQSLHPKTPSWVLTLRKLKMVPMVMLKYLW